MTPPTQSSADRIDVRKTYKLYIGGAFPRSESGRSYVGDDAKGKFLANASYASRKDARDAVQAARKAFGGWSARTAYNRGQVVYRVAEVLEGRRAQFVDDVQRSEGASKRAAEAAVDESVDRLVWYAGWADKVAQVVGGTNPVAAPYFNFSVPEPTGVVAVLAPQQSSLLGLVSVVAPVIVTGNTCVVATSATLLVWQGLPDLQRRAHARGPVALERAVERPLAARELAAPLRDAAGQRLWDDRRRASRPALDDAQVVRVLAADRELDDRRAGPDLRA